MTLDDQRRLIDDLHRDEGIRLRPYLDTVGKWTIGVGRNLSDVGITKTEAMYLLENDVEKCLRDCQTFPWFDALDGVRQRVVMNMRFNLGPSRFRAFKKTLLSIANGDYATAADQMLQSKWSEQVGARATRLADMMRTGMA